MIRAKEVTKIYKGDLFETVALNHVSFSIEEGEFVAVMGESGSGKSTLLHILGGMDTLTEGELEVKSTKLHELTQKEMDKFRKENISFVFQHFALMEEYTVFENMESPLLARNVSKKDRKERITAELERLGVLELKDKYPTQLSGGQQQRVAIARALVTGAPILLADEPTGALDEGNTKNLMELLQSIHKDGKTIILITHDQQVATYADRVMRLKDGVIV